MAELLGLGMTHAPMFQFPDAHMADILRRHLRREDLPTQWQDGSAWPAAMRAEWGTDEGATAAVAHRARVVDGFRRMRAALDDFRPDFVLVFGDDQYENFREDLVPPFCLFLHEEVECQPFANSRALDATANVWGQPPEKRIMVRGHRAAASELATALIDEGFDIAYAYTPRHHPGLAHAFLRTLVYLDYDQRGFDYPLVPFHVNCYGSELLTRAPGPTPADVPPAPTPRRCYDLGRALGRILARSKYRVALVGSSSWSHAFLTRKFHGLVPDIAADRARFAELAAGRTEGWRDLSRAELVASGQHELLNWICLAGAMEGRRPDHADLAETHIFNSGKVCAIYSPANLSGANHLPGI